jgi:outer membrane protein assembly factor BamB
MSDNGEILNEAEVEFLLASGGEEDGAATPATGTEGQTVTMRGDLEQINLADIFQTLAMSKMEGVLRVHNPLEERQILCRDGYVRILVPGRLATRRLGQRLIQAGLLQPEQLKAALLSQRKQKRPLGTMLVQAGLIQQEQIDELVGMQLGEDLFALFTWRHGAFEFYKGPVTNDVQRAAFEACPEFEVNSLLLEVARRSDEWQSILEALYSLDEIPKRIADPADESDLDDTHRTLLATVDGKQTWRDLAEQTTHGLFEIARGARDLVRGGLLANVDDGAMVAAALQYAEAGNGKKAVLLLQTLRDRPGDRPLGILHGMAKALEAAGERRLAGGILLEAAQRQTDPATAIDLAHKARSLAPYDPEALSFLRTILVAHAPADSPELEKCTLDLLDALIEGDKVPAALDIIEDARRTGSLRPQIMLREARARQKQRDIPGACTVLFELAQHYEAQQDRPRAIEAYESLLKLDRSRKDVQKLLNQRRRTRVGTIVRWASAAAALAMISGTGLVLWQHQTFTAQANAATNEITKLLDDGDRAAARERWEHWFNQLGACEVVEDLRNRIAFADATEQGRQQKLFRARVNEQLTIAAETLGRGELAAALSIYRALSAEPSVRTEVGDVVETRLNAVLGTLEGMAKGLPTRLPPPPDTLFDRRDLLQQLAELQAICPPTQLRLVDELTTMSQAAMPELLTPALQARIRALVQDSGGVFAAATGLATAYAEALQRNDQQRRLDPMFKAAVERETARDFAGALELYRQLEQQPAGDASLRAHFRDQIARNATICRLLSALATATESGDYEAAQQQRRALQTTFPDVEFDDLITLPMRLESQPSGADVEIDGKVVGTTPFLWRRAVTKPARVRLHREGFVAAAKTVQGDAGGQWLAYLSIAASVAWSIGSAVESNPTLLPNGDIVLVDRSGGVRAMPDHGTTPRWTWRSGDLSGLLTAAVPCGDWLLVGSLDGELRALTASSGIVAWQLPDLPMEVSPRLVGNQLVGVTTKRQLFVLDLEQRTPWLGPLPEASHHEVQVHGDTVMVVGERGTTMAFSLPGRRSLWQQNTGLANPSARIRRGVLVLSDDRGDVVGLDPATGETRWRRSLGVELLGPPTELGDDLLFTTADALLRVSPTRGEVVGSYRGEALKFAHQALAVGNRVVAPLVDGGVQVLDDQLTTPLYRIEASRRARLLAGPHGLLLAESDHTMQVYRKLR